MAEWMSAPVCNTRHPPAKERGMGWFLTTQKWLGLIIVWGLLAGCATTNTAPKFEPLKASVEALYLNYWDLKGLHSDLRAAARVHIEESGAQLAEIQSAARFIQQANLIAFYQWELLSITEYIRESARRDFFTLRARDLIDARDKSHNLILSVQIYEAFIRDPQALELIAACIQRIEKHMALYQQMAQALQKLQGMAADDRQASMHRSILGKLPEAITIS
jgi:hypothetical protein